jgi:hypothetical protein
MRAAAENKNPDVIIALLEAGADAKIKNDAGLMAVDLAEENERMKGSAALLKLREASR